MIAKRGICPVCGQDRLVRADGNLAVHRNLPTGRRYSINCPGSAHPPKPFDPVDDALAAFAAAEQRGRQWAIDALRDQAVSDWNDPDVPLSIGFARAQNWADAADWLEKRAETLATTDTTETDEH